MFIQPLDFEPESFHSMPCLFRVAAIVPSKHEASGLVLLEECIAPKQLHRCMLWPSSSPHEAQEICLSLLIHRARISVACLMSNLTALGGSTGASWITQALLLCLGSIQKSMPIIAATFLGVITAWITSVRLLNKQLQVHSPKPYTLNRTTTSSSRYTNSKLYNLYRTTSGSCRYTTLSPQPYTDAVQTCCFAEHDGVAKVFPNPRNKSSPQLAAPAMLYDS